jgi:hypothetical protein
MMDVAARVADQDWPASASALDERGYAVLPGFLARGECAACAGLFDEPTHFRSRIVMARHGYGRGEYRYFAYPLPPFIAALRSALYPPLATIANAWQATRADAAFFPPDHAGFLAHCHAAGQLRATPLLLSYGAGDYNCLHQDVYGPQLFPLQVALLLSAPGRDFGGGEFVVTEQRPRRQSRVEVVPLGQGDAVVFAVRERPVRGARGSYRVNLRHGVSRVTHGTRRVLGLIFHDAA